MKSFLLSIAFVLVVIRNSVQQAPRIDCYPDAAALFGESVEQKCRDRNCIYQQSSVANEPWCFFPQESFGYTLDSYVKVKNGFVITLNRLTKYAATFPDPVNSVKLEVKYLNKKTLHFKLVDATKSRYEVPIELENVEDASLVESETDLEFLFENRVQDSVFVFKVKRRSTGVVLFDTSVGGLVFSDQFLQIATRLPSNSNVYGFGENNHPSLSHDFNYKTWGIFTRDQSTAGGENTNQYGSQPFYTVLEEDGNSHGVVFLNSNAMDYEFSPLPLLIMRSIGGVFDFYVFSGPEPEAVTQQFTSLVGRPFMIPYFALGFQLARWNYKDLNDMKKIVERNIDAGIHLDVQYADIEHYKDQMDFTIDEIKFKDLPIYFKSLQSRGMRVVIILDPALVISRGNSNYKPFVEGVKNDVFIKWPKGMSPDYSETNSDIMLGYCWPNDKVGYPDFMNKRTRQWWNDLIVEYRKANISFDALWIDMNEPAVFNTNEEKPWNWPPDKYPYWTLKCPKNKLDDPPYRTKAVYRYDSPGRPERLSQLTLCMTGLQEDGKYTHYDVHNLYGWSESQATQVAVRNATGKRSFILTRSTFIGNGRYAGHWLGDNAANYVDMHRSIIGMIEFSMFGIPYNGADICGFLGTTEEELCTRWMQLGAFYPFSRNHNDNTAPDQDPAAFSQYSIDSSKRALNIRYTILPYYYTLFYRAHTQGTQVTKGLFQEFPKDKNCRTIDRQFLVGSAFLVTPVLDKGKSTVDAYLPPSSKWYSYYDGATSQTGYVKLNAPMNFINLHIRGGHILPTQEPANTTFYSRQNPFGLIVALNDKSEAEGELFYDDGDSLDSISESRYFRSTFSYKNDQLKMQIQVNNGNVMNGLLLNTVRIMGLPKKISSVSVVTKNRLQIVDPSSYTLNQFGEVKLTNLRISMATEFIININTTAINGIIPVPAELDLNDPYLRVDCHVEYGASEWACMSRGCSWVSTPIQGIPWCFFNKQRVGYVVKATASKANLRNRITAQYSLTKSDSFQYYGGHVNNVKVTVEQKGANKVRIQFKDADKKRYEVPVPTTWPEETNEDVNKNDFDVYVENDKYGRFILEVFRKSTGTRLLSTREYAEAFVFSDKFIQFYARLPSESVYGFGENTHQRFKHSFKYDSPTFPLFARDEPPTGGSQNLYGVHPFYMAIEEDGRAHGLLILNSNAQDYKFSALQTFGYKTIGGILDIYMFSGPTPENVIQQYTEVIGKPFLPPYYALGFQLCRYGYDNLANLKAAVDRTIAANIPLDIQYADIDYFDRQLDFTYDKVNFAGLPEYINQIKQQGIRFIPILDPALMTSDSNYLPYQRGQQQDVWIKWPSGMNPQFSETGNNNMLGYVWPPGKVVFPDFFQNKTVEWWSNELKLYYETIKYDGLWIDMNEPANFGTNEDKPFNWPSNLPAWSLKCPVNEYDDPPYVPNVAFGKRISDKTLCLVGEQTNGVEKFKHYDVHNLYGWSETIATYKALQTLDSTKRPLVISRSTFPSSGKYAGHWLGDNESTWKQLKYNIIGLLEFNLFGIPYVGADICGFFGTADGELCLRWMQLGAFNPFFRNHNSIYNPDQDPGVYSSDIVSSIRKAVEIRYSLLPYLYTLFYEAHVNGGTVVRSLVHEFSRDKNTHDVDEQFLWGSALLISPVIEQGKTQVNAYLPKESKWYDYYTGKEEVSSTGYVTLSAPRDVIPLHVRGGYIIPTQEVALNTDKSRVKPFGLIVAPDSGKRARGELFWDENGISANPIANKRYNLYKFDYDENTQLLQSRIESNNLGGDMKNLINTIKIFNYPARPFQILIDGVTKHTSYNYNSATRELDITNLQIQFNKYFYLKFF